LHYVVINFINKGNSHHCKHKSWTLHLRFIATYASVNKLRKCNLAMYHKLDATISTEISILFQCQIL